MMKIELLSDGTLLIHAENDIEAYALGMWEKGKKKLVIDLESDRRSWESIRKFNETMSTLGPLAKDFKKWLHEKESPPNESECVAKMQSEKRDTDGRGP